MRHILVLRNPPDDDDDDDEEVEHGSTVHHHTHHHHTASNTGVGTYTDSVACKHSHPVYDEVYDRMHNPPSTWSRYSGSHDGGYAIIKMEFEELLAAHASIDKHSIKKELGDLAAACMTAMKQMY